MKDKIERDTVAANLLPSVTYTLKLYLKDKISLSVCPFTMVHS